MIVRGNDFLKMYNCYLVIRLDEKPTDGLAVSWPIRYTWAVCGRL